MEKSRGESKVRVVDDEGKVWAVTVDWTIHEFLDGEDADGNRGALVRQCEVRKLHVPARCPVDRDDIKDWFLHDWEDRIEEGENYGAGVF